MENGSEGAAYQVTLWSSDRSTDPESDAQHIADYWESLGMGIHSVDHGQYPVIYATGGPVLRATVDTDAANESYNIAAVAPCAPGDAGDLKRETNEQRKQGERFPGDEYVPEEHIDEAYKKLTLDNFSAEISQYRGIGLRHKIVFARAE